MKIKLRIKDHRYWCEKHRSYEGLDMREIVEGFSVHKIDVLEIYREKDKRDNIIALVDFEPTTFKEFEERLGKAFLSTHLGKIPEIHYLKITMTKKEAKKFREVIKPKKVLEKTAEE